MWKFIFSLFRDKTCYIDNVPFDIIYMIVDLLKVLDIISFIQTCKRFNLNKDDKFWKSLCIKRYGKIKRTRKLNWRRLFWKLETGKLKIIKVIHENTHLGSIIVPLECPTDDFKAKFLQLFLDSNIRIKVDKSVSNKNKFMVELTIKPYIPLWGRIIFSTSFEPEFTLKIVTVIRQCKSSTNRTYSNSGIINFSLIDTLTTERFNLIKIIDSF